MWSEETNRSLFQKELSSCHGTIFPIAPAPELLGNTINVFLMKKSLVDAINDEHEPGTEIGMTVLDDMDRWFRRAKTVKARRLCLLF
jgi:hypothetical protein